MAEPVDIEINAVQKQLIDLPDEILLDVLSYLTEISLLMMTRVSKRFQKLAKEVFGRKYSGENGSNGFEMGILFQNEIDENNIPLRPFFCTFGDNMHAIEIALDAIIRYDRNCLLYGLLPRYCTVLTKLDIYTVDADDDNVGVDLTKILRQLPTLTHFRLNDTEIFNHSWTKHSYPNLISFELDRVYYKRSKKRDLGQFFKHNRQIKELRIQHYIDSVNIFDSLSGKMNALKSVELSSHGIRGVPKLKSKVFKLNTLESVSLSDGYATFDILKAISKGCSNIVRLKVDRTNSEDKWNDDAIRSICSLEKLTSLEIVSNGIEAAHLIRFIDTLPNLSSLCVTDIPLSEAIECLHLYIVPVSRKSINLEFEIAVRDISLELSVDFMKNIAKSIQRNDSKVTLKSRKTRLTFSKGQVRQGDVIIYNTCTRT